MDGMNIPINRRKAIKSIPALASMLTLGMTVNAYTDKVILPDGYEMEERDFYSAKHKGKVHQLLIHHKNPKKVFNIAWKIPTSATRLEIDENRRIATHHCLKKIEDRRLT